MEARPVSNNFQNWVQQGESLYTEALEQFHQLEAQLADVERQLAEKQEEVNRIAQMAAQMATAVEEQAHVSEDINRQVARISELAHTSLLKGTASMEKSQSMEQTAENLHELVERFKHD